MDKMEQWKMLIPEGTHKIEYFTVVNNKIFVELLENASSRLNIHNLEGKFISNVELPSLGTIYNINGEDEGDEIFYIFSSFLIPSTVYRYDLAANTNSIFKKPNSGIEANSFSVDQVWYHSRDTTRIPMFLVHRKDLKKNAENPTMLYGYGGFGISTTPYFDKSLIPFLEKGGVYAVANIRGGGEFGETWYKAAVRENKQKSYDDFIAAAEWLIDNNYTDARHLALFGWSNGGLLVSAVMTQRPELFKAVVIGAPVLDMIRYHMFHGGRRWIRDYASSEDPDHFKNLMTYSPYHNVKDGQQYPAVLIVTADQDDRVHPLHAYKMAARLQEANTSESPILLRVEIRAGHGGAKPIYKTIEQYADIWGFVFEQLGIRE